MSDLLWALERVIDTTNEHDRARDAHDGYSWDYHGAALIFERDKARADFMTRLEALIDERVRIALAGSSEPPATETKAATKDDEWMKKYNDAT